MNFKIRSVIKRFYFFLFLVISIVSLQYRLKSTGTLLFLIYLLFVILFKPPVRITIYFALISLILVPFLFLGSFNYSAGIFAVFSFLLISLSVVQIFFDFKKNHENK